MKLVQAILHGTAQDVINSINAGEDVHTIDDYGYPPLIETAIANSTEKAKILIEKGAQADVEDVTGNTALHWAVENNNLELCQLLLENKADPNAYTVYGQPVLLIPLLRGNQEIKRLLIKHGANLEFAQDYLNTKLIGHRFELTGRVDILDHKGTFFEIDLEGFILEFTLALVYDSLARFKNNFAARHLREDFADIQHIINAIGFAAQLIKYQQYLVNVSEHEKTIDRILDNPLLILPMGYEGHAITFVCYGEYFSKIDRGEESLKNPSVQIFKVTNRRALTKQFFKVMLYQKHNKQFVTKEINKILGLQLIDSIDLPSQITGNCSWANVQGAIPTALYILNNFNDKQRAQNIYNQWEKWDQDRALHLATTRFDDASPARKAAIGASLAAVLFQQCNFEDPKDAARINKIMASLSTPGYEYILQSYIEVYAEQYSTKEGKNLLAMLDIYGK